MTYRAHDMNTVPGAVSSGGHGAFVSALAMLALLGAVGLATLVDMLTGPDTPRQERIAPTPPLPLDRASLLSFPGAAKHYAAERYALKDSFITLNARVKLGLFNHSPYTRVLLGRRDTLFLGNDGVVAGVQGIRPAPQSSDAAWVDLFRKMDRAFAERGLPLVHLLAPDKHAILPEDLPDWLAPAAVPRVSRLVARLSTEITPPPVDIVTLFAEHRRDRDARPLYHPTDTHWTEYGAALAVDAALAPVLRIDPGTIALDLSVSAVQGGDLARMIGMQRSIADTAPLIGRPARLSCTTPDGTSVMIESLDPLPVHRFACRNPDGPAGRALVFMDSFGMAAVPRLTQIFQQTEFVWTDAMDMALVDAIAPDLVVRIMVARKLQDQNAAGMLKAAP